MLHFLHNKQYQRFTVLFFVLFYLVGFGGIALPATRQLFIWLTPISLLMSFAVLLLFHNGFNKNFLFFFSAVFLSGFLLEVAGVKTGMIFGNYYYGDALGFKIAEVPLLIGINWVMMVYFSISIIHNFQIAGQFKLLLSALMLVVFDLSMEPVAPFMDMWHWPGGYAPFQNYVAWFFAALVFITIGKSFRVDFNNKLAPALFIIQFLFFVSLNILKFFI